MPHLLIILLIKHAQNTWVEKIKSKKWINEFMVALYVCIYFCVTLFSWICFLFVKYNVMEYKFN